MRPEGNLSEADKSNGITWRGSVHIKYAINDPEKDAWQNGTSTYHLIKKNGTFQVGLGRECRLNGAPGMVIP